MIALNFASMIAMNVFAHQREAYSLAAVAGIMQKG